jgi:hypothetical protein
MRARIQLVFALAHMDRDLKFRGTADGVQSAHSFGSQATAFENNVSVQYRLRDAAPE